VARTRRRIEHLLLTKVSDRDRNVKANKVWLCLYKLCAVVDVSESMASGRASSAFKALRETVYTEVDTLISQNESCPHYLVELFRQLQMLSTDFFRQRGLFAIHYIVARYFSKVRRCGYWSQNGLSLDLSSLHFYVKVKVN